jgi:threonine/homoserine/homoserine lactone efflux protein
MHLTAFLVVAAVIVITPGVDTALVTRNALVYGRRPAVMTALGVNLGILLWATTAAVGLAAVIAASATAFNTIRLVGVAYLVYLGIRALLTAGHGSDAGTATGPRLLDDRAALRQGLVSNALNPKVAVLFTGLLPSSSARTAPPRTCSCLASPSTRWAASG